MKKNFLLAMVVMLMTAVSSFAQKEYNMVITLSNGTTVTLGHNDIKEITFNDGEVAISGNMVNTIDSLAQVSQNLETHIKAVEARSMEMSYEVLNRTDKLNQQVDFNMADTKAALQNANELIKQQSDEIKVLNARIDVLKTLIEKYHPEE
jgi:cell division protein FtsB